MANTDTLLQHNAIPIDPLEGADPAVASRAVGTVIALTLTSDAISTVYEAGFRRVAVERSRDGGLSWQEITKPSDRPLIESAQSVVKYYDRRGDPNFLYRFRYAGVFEHGEELSAPSAAIPGVGLATSGVLTPEQLRSRYFFGVDLTNDKGEPLPDAVWEHNVLSAIRWMEHQIDVPILPSSFVEKHDYYRSDYSAYAMVKLDNCPVLSVESFRVQYPSGQSVIEFPLQWLRLNNVEGQIQIVPTAGTLSQVLVGAGGSFLPAIYGGLSYLPQLFEVSYTAGFAIGQVPRNIVDIIGLVAMTIPLGMFGDLVAGAGIANLSLGMDGLSQSIGTTASAENTAYGARIKEAAQVVKQQIPLLRRYYKGMRLAVA